MKKTKYFIKLTVLFAVMLTAFALTAFAGIHGDVDKDNEVTAADARLALRASVKLENYPEGSPEFIAADVDGNKELTAADARRILRAAVKLETLDHVFGDKVYTSSSKTPTCTEGTEYYTECVICGEKTEGGESKLGHNKGAMIIAKSSEATCTKNGVECYKCSRCGEEYSITIKAPGHKYNTNAATLTLDKVCTVCGQVAETSFNTRVNALKDGTHKFSGFSYTDSSVKTGAEKMEFSSTFKGLINLMGGDGEDMPSETELLKELKDMIKENFTEANGYSYPITDRTISNYNFSLIDADDVSRLTDADAKSVKTETVSGIDFLKELDDTITVNGYPYSLARFKNANTGNVSKVTIELNDDRYSELKNGKTETGIMKIADMNIRELAEGFNVSVNDMGDFFGDMGDAFGMKCKEAVSSATVTYYFDKANGAPVAAKYNTSYTLDASCYIKFTTASIISLITGDGSEDFSDSELKEMMDWFGSGTLIDGNVDFTTTCNETCYFFFDDYFPAI